MAKGSGKKNDAVEKAGNKSLARGRRFAWDTRPEKTTVKGLMSVGQIAVKLGVSVSRVQYVIRSRELRPTHIVDNLRFFSSAAVRHIGRELEEIVKDRLPGRESAVLRNRRTVDGAVRR